MENYEEYLNTWLAGIDDEIMFWDNYIRNEGGDYFYSFYKTVDSKRFFELEGDIPKEYYGKQYTFVDVGSGPFSRCGRVTDKVDLKAVSVDPLAMAYSLMKREYGVDNGVELKHGFVELLEYEFEENSFDMVHMSNSLDHSFSALDGIWQLLYICKVGGKVILRHHENEAEEEQYQGFHQWNLSLHNPENSFVIWRGNVRYDVCKIFEEYADIELYKDVQEKGGQWIYNKVVMTKKKAFKLNNNKYYDLMLKKVYGYLLENMTNNIMKTEVIISDKDMRLNVIKKRYHNLFQFKEALAKNKIGSAAIYGMGPIGKNLAFLLENAGINLVLLIDRLGKQCGHQSAVKLDDVEAIDADITIVTVTKDAELVMKMIKGKAIGNVVYIDDFLKCNDKED